MARIVVTTLVGLFVMMAHPPRAHAFAPCAGMVGLAPASTAVLPPRPRLVYFAERPGTPAFAASIDGEPVTVDVKPLSNGYPHLVELRIDSARTGRLEVTATPPGADAGTRVVLGTYTIERRPRVRRVTAVIHRYVASRGMHSSGPEQVDALALQFASTAPVAYLTVKLRRDDGGPWTTLLTPVAAEGRARIPMALIGELGCRASFPVALLEGGVDITVKATLASGKTVTVDGVPARVTLPPR
ncbi:MAG: hypothetical protein JNK64_06410 [Myxococcales bacterium]|nr:hypothetical protein [Myxococcales bacterium]